MSSRHEDNEEQMHRTTWVGGRENDLCSCVTCPTEDAAIKIDFFQGNLQNKWHEYTMAI